MKIVNTLDAHVLLEYAHKLGKQTALKIRLFSAYFTEHKDISDREVLMQEAEKVGISVIEAKGALSNVQMKSQIKARISQWQQMGVTGVPTVVFNQTSTLTGAQPQETFKQVLLELAESLED